MPDKRKTVLVTGASGGIGQGICRRLAKDWNLVLHYNNNADAAEKLQEELTADGGVAIVAQADLSDEQSVLALFDQAIGKFGSLEAVVANAGNSHFGNISGSSTDDFRRIIDVNIIGSYLTIRTAADRIADGGKIVFVSSQLSQRPRATTGMYSACKAAIDALIVSMSHELGERKICINAVRPGATEPGLFANSPEERKQFFRALSPFKRLGTPEDTAGVVAFLISAEASWVTGQHLRVDGGASN